MAATVAVLCLGMCDLMAKSDADADSINTSNNTSYYNNNIEY